MKRWTAFALSVSLLFTLAGCTVRQNHKPSGATLEIDMKHSYVAECITLMNGDTQEQSQADMQNGMILAAASEHLFLQYGNNLYAYNLKSKQFRELSPQMGKGNVQETSPYVIPTSDGEINILYQNWGNDDYASSYEQYDAQLNLIGFGDIPDEVFNSATTDGCYIDSDEYWYSISIQDQTVIRLFDPDFQYLTDINTKDVVSIKSVFCGVDGRIHLIYQGINGKLHLGVIERDSGQIRELFTGKTISDSCARGNSEYPFIYWNDKGMYGLSEDGSEDLLLDWSSSDMDFTHLSLPLLLEDGRIAVNEFNQEVIGTTITIYTDQWLLRKRTAREIADTQIVGLAAVGAQADILSDLVTQFNRQSQNVRIVLYNYNQFNTEQDNTLGTTQFQKDMLNGRIADIICTDELLSEELEHKNIFLDLSDLVASDPDITEERYYMNFFEAFQRKEKLPRISFSFTLDTMVAKKELIGTDGQISASQYMQILEDLPDDMQLYYQVDANDIVATFCTDHLNAFLDPASGTCSFDSEEFRRILQIAARYTKQKDSGLGIFDPTLEQQQLIRNNTLLLQRAVYAVPYTWHAIREIYFQDEPIASVGFPIGNNEIGSYFVPEYTLAINAESLYQEEAWLFFKYLLSDNVQRRLWYTLPVNRTVMHEKMQEAMNPPINPVDGSSGFSHQIDGQEVKLRNATEEEMELLEQEIMRTTQNAYTNAKITAIIEEEAGMYFANDQSLDQTCTHIQNRVQLYLSEHA